MCQMFDLYNYQSGLGGLLICQKHDAQTVKLIARGSTRQSQYWAAVQMGSTKVEIKK